ncbi:M20/M25/M40 family metallo-hydrolase [Granulicella tundricola]|uniref:Peptidase M28 n=1 Tax=Granulicella tundricola (strain ATCC BAA-1859 / DSM 23138 / MP5ACTX9) TaxID=1198114 RepID=E8X3B3_GRATM|nr:M20/M25/M40 family metallo-hydrolase [Granulicella tundricola]ADW70414.1 peptidase M28 [Granulicella tundricola MP5ACTX9]
MLETGKKKLKRVRLTKMLCSAVFAVTASAGLAQVKAPVHIPESGDALPIAAADPEIAGALAKISPDDVRNDIAKLVSFSNRSTVSSTVKDLPAGTGVTAAADWIFAEFTRISAACGNCLEVKRDDFIEPAATGPNGRIKQDTRIQNIYAVLPGTDPAQKARRVLVTGHYDSRVTDVMDTHTPAPGANDDASGVAVSIESARVLSKLKFPATIVFVAVAGEEQGLNGSRHLAKLAKAEGWSLEAALNNDIVGGDTTPGDTGQDKSAVRVFSEGVPGPATPEEVRAIQNLGAEGDSPSRELARAITEVSDSYFKSSSIGAAKGRPGQPHSHLVRYVPPFHPVLIFRRDRFLRGGDHTSFNAEGFAAVRFTEWQENFNHQHQTPRTENGVLYEDNIQFVDMSYVANVARLNAATLATFARAPGEPENVHILTRGLDNNTELTWTAPAGAPAGTIYQVLWRPSDAPVWTNLQSAGSAMTIKLPISKDNVVFGVRTSDAAGHTSPAVLPKPQGR